jgi:DNA-binding NtrC family response regulator
MAGEKILIVDDERGMLSLLDKVLSKEGYYIKTATDADSAFSLIKSEEFDLIVTDIDMPKKDGIELLKEIRNFSESINVIMITAYATVESAINAMKLGAYDYITKPFQIDEIKMVIKKALERERLIIENKYLRNELKTGRDFQGVKGKSPAIQRAFELANSVAASNANVLIEGESGTGKELIARFIHYSSARSDKPFVVLNCSALPEGILESELFGHEKGAFSGAVSKRKGRFELSQNGTIFIDEVGDLTPHAQIKLLRVLQEHEFERVGGTRTIKLDVRIVAATNKKLYEEMKKDKFREDLYYRLNVVNIEIPPLRERKEDIPELAHYFINKYSKEMNKKVTGISKETMKIITEYDWPGNVRELENVIERGIVLARKENLSPEDLPIGVRESDANKLTISDKKKNLTEILDDLEAQLMLKTLVKYNYSQTKAAKSLGIKRTTLRYKMEKYHLMPPKGIDDVDDIDENLSISVDNDEF